MIEQLVPYDDLLNHNLFLADEVRYNLLHRICESEESTCLKTSDGNMIFAQSPGHKAWLWISQQIIGNHQLTYIEQLLRYLKGNNLPGVCGDVETVEKFANAYAERHTAQVHTHMVMESYFCPEYKKPLGVGGILRQAISKDVQLVAQFLAGFAEEALDHSVDPASQISAAEAAELLILRLDKPSCCKRAYVCSFKINKPSDAIYRWAHPSIIYNSLFYHTQFRVNRRSS
ncbi:acetyltransferase [Paenibacillus sp. EKM202P]|uniref:acetyltransferase n=1 Tax=unclassified Paenibacillus TaxID=185978 RepID=UPI0013ED9A50|nr:MULTISPECIES: acetyltransferase [unclassified Paenibacillus]KAF6563670.1 acetyltransferase [Paenibacillus sp. EKM202P]KAF6568691.1 acetyltransferase [Paenibacillus sp. EKM207P]